MWYRKDCNIVVENIVILLFIELIVEKSVWRLIVCCLDCKGLVKINSVIYLVCNVYDRIIGIVLIIIVVY